MNKESENIISAKFLKSIELLFVPFESRFVRKSRKKTRTIKIKGTKKSSKAKTVRA